jgi:hypothetical protein
MRKYFEQKSDEIGFSDANKNFIMTHGCSSIGWTSYKNSCQRMFTLGIWRVGATLRSLMREPDGIE